jgi:hypothetical protein
MNREESWAKARKNMKHWKLPNDFWTAMEKGVHGYTQHPVGGAIDTPFPPTYDNRRNRLKLAFGNKTRSVGTTYSKDEWANN